MDHERIDRTLAEMAALDPKRASAARAVLDWLTGGEGLDVLDLAGMLRFAWYGLPMKWAGPPGWYESVLEAAADVLERLGFERYA